MAQARTEPPSEQRIAEARAFGHTPRTVILGAALLFASIGALLHWLHRPLTVDLAALFRAPFIALASGASFDARAHLQAAFTTFAPYLAVLLVGAAAASALALALVQGFRFRVPRQKPRHPFAKATNTRGLVGALSAFFVSVVVALSVHDALWGVHEDLTAVFMRAALRLSIVLLLIAACDAALARAAFWRSLWMTRQQVRDEDRQAYGSPEMRTERERVRRELGKSAP